MRCKHIHHLARPVLLALSLSLAGCADRASSPSQKYFPTNAGPPVVDGMTMDDSATPKQIVWALLTAIVADVNADSAETRDGALRLQCQLADLDGLRARIGQLYKGDDIDDALFERGIKLWAPALSYYVPYLDERFDVAVKRMVDVKAKDGSDRAQVTYILPNETHGGPAGLKRGVAMVFFLGQQAGVWRIQNVIFGRSPDLSPHGRGPGA